MRRNRIELLSAFLILLGILFYYWILGNDFSGKKVILIILVFVNVLGFIINIKYFDLYVKNSYVTLMGYLSTLGFIIITAVLEILELIKAISPI